MAFGGGRVGRAHSAGICFNFLATDGDDSWGKRTKGGNGGEILTFL